MSTEKDPYSPERKRNIIADPKKFGAGVLSIMMFFGAIGYAAHGVVDKFKGNSPEFSKATKEITAMTGYTLYGDIIPEIQINSKIDPRKVANYIVKMPENDATFENGMLDDGETVTIPLDFGVQDKSPDK